MGRIPDRLVNESYAAAGVWSSEGVRNISNELTIGTKIDRCSPNLEEEARKLGLYTESMGPFNFSAVFSESGKVPENRMSFRYRHGLKMLKDLSASGEYRLLLLP